MNKVGSFQRVWSLLGVVCSWNSNHALLNPGVLLISESSNISQHDTGLKEVQRIYIYVMTCPGMTSRRCSTWTMVKFTRAIVFQAVLPTHLQHCTGPGRLKPVRCNNHDKRIRHRYPTLHIISVTLGLHYVPGGHGSPGSPKRNAP